MPQLSMKNFNDALFWYYLYVFLRNFFRFFFFSRRIVFFKKISLSVRLRRTSTIDTWPVNQCSLFEFRSSRTSILCSITGHISKADNHSLEPYCGFLFRVIRTPVLLPFVLRGRLL